MMPYYILRLLPPIGDMSKYVFPDTSSMMKAIEILRDSLDVDQIHASVAAKNIWKSSPDDCFQDCIVITRVDPELCLKHEDYFTKLNTEPKLIYTSRYISDEISELKTA